MRQWMTQLPTTVRHEGRDYRVQVVGAERNDRTWEARLLFRDGDSPALSTGPETSQPNRDALEYWATGLERIYLEGALQRAIERNRRQEKAS